MYITFLVGQLVLAANLLANVTFYLYGFVLPQHCKGYLQIYLIKDV